MPLFLCGAVPLGGRTNLWTRRGASTSAGCCLTIAEEGSTPQPRWDALANGRLNGLSKSLREHRRLIPRMRRKSSSLGCRPYSNLNSSHTASQMKRSASEADDYPYTNIVIASVCRCPVTQYPNSREGSLKRMEHEHAKSISLPHTQVTERAA
jgi:hypothetical protein